MAAAVAVTVVVAVAVAVSCGLVDTMHRRVDSGQTSTLVDNRGLTC